VMRAYAGRGEDLANAPGAWAGVSRRAGEGHAVRPSFRAARPTTSRLRALASISPRVEAGRRKPVMADDQVAVMRALGFARLAVVRHDRSGQACTGWRATILLPWSGLRCSPWRGPRPWLRALTTSLIEAQPLGADVRRAHLRGRRLRGADRPQASLGKPDLSDADRLGADLRGADLSRAEDLRKTALGTA
jgi:hypothetical protein